MSNRLLSWMSRPCPPAFKVTVAFGWVLAVTSCVVQTRHDTMPTTTDEKYVEIRGVRIHYREDGISQRSKPSLMLIHGFGASLESWFDVTPILAEKMHVIRLDLRGFGLSGKPSDEAYSLDEQAEIVTEFVEKTARGPVVLAGHSYGGGVAFLTYLKLRERHHSDRVAALILIDAASYPQSLPFFVAQLRNPVTRFIAENLTTPEWRTRHVLERLFVDKTRVDSARIERYARFLRLPNAEHALATVAAQVVPANLTELSDKLKTIDVPTLVIWGGKDPAIPVAFAYRLAQDIRGARLLVIPDVGHVPHEERPAATAGAILEFVTALATPSPC
jgi:pimeloyl-ACP methyl ester carboxylesterase